MKEKKKRIIKQVRRYERREIKERRRGNGKNAEVKRKDIRKRKRNLYWEEARVGIKRGEKRWIERKTYIKVHRKKDTDESRGKERLIKR